MFFSAQSTTGSRTARLRVAAALTLSASLLLVTACSDDEPEGGESAAPSAVPPSAAPSASPSAQESVEPSKNLDAITVKGEAPDPPQVTFEAPWAIDKSQNKVLEQGDGDKVPDGGFVEVNYQGINGRTGEPFDDSYSRGAPVAFNVDGVVAGFKKGLVGQQVGSRVLLAMPGEDGYDEQGGQPDAGIEVGDSLIFVVDIVSTQLSGPDGEEVAPKDGLPTVSGDTPKISIPDGDPPKELVSQPLIKGEGKEVGETDAVTVNYRAVTWSDGKVVEDSYGKAPETGELSTLIEGWKTGLAGQTVGSRMLLVVPPDQAYPDGNESPRIDKGETLVYVVDLLFTQPTS